MKLAGVKLDHINSKNTSVLDKNYKEQKTKRGGAANSIVTTPLNQTSPLNQSSTPATAPKPPPLLKDEDYKILEARLEAARENKSTNGPQPKAKADPKSPDEARKTAEKELKEKISLIRRILAYKTRPATRHLPGMDQIAVPTARDDIIAVRVIHEQCKRICNVAGSADIIEALIGILPTLMEKATMDWGYNYGDLDLRGFGDSWGALSEIMDQEITELKIEYEDTFASPVWLRSLQKIANVAFIYSEKKKRASMAAAAQPPSSRASAAADDI